MYACRYSVGSVLMPLRAIIDSGRAGASARQFVVQTAVSSRNLRRPYGHLLIPIKTALEVLGRHQQGLNALSGIY